MDQPVLFVVTKHGAFLSRPTGPSWETTGPLLNGREVSTLFANSNRVFAGVTHSTGGASLWVSDDDGATWRQIEGGPRFSPESGVSLNRIWRIVPGIEPGVLYAGVVEAALFVSRNAGETWAELPGLSRHPSRGSWRPSAGGLCLHTILPDPRNPDWLHVAISDGGLLRTRDGGETWETCHSGLPGPEDPGQERLGHGVVRAVRDPTSPDRLYVKHRQGVFQSDNSGDSWYRIDEGLPSRFGFAMVITSAGHLFVVPLDGETRCFPDGKVQVFRRKTGASQWEALSAGLPDAPHYTRVLRDGMAVDSRNPAGLYLGTTHGDLFHSPNEGERWERIPGQFSRVEFLAVGR